MDNIQKRHQKASKEHTEKYVFPKLESEMYSGMELRDYFAGTVLQAFCLENWPVNAAQKSYEYADAMLEVRNKEQK